MGRLVVLACDYDGTVATQGRLDAHARAALERWRACGRKLVLVTGRELRDLGRALGELGLFELPGLRRPVARRLSDEHQMTMSRSEQLAGTAVGRAGRVRGAS